VEASQRVVLSKRAHLEGNLLAPVVVIEDGAMLNGTVRMPLPDDPKRLGRTPPEALAADEQASSGGEAGN